MGAEAKICGLRRPEDAEHAAACGAAYLGVVLDDGPRQVREALLPGIVRAAGRVPVMLVVVRAAIDEVLRVRDRSGIQGVQLHGGQDAAMAASLQQEGLRVWRSVRLGCQADVERLDEWTASADAVLVEPRVPGRRGGAGVPLELALALAARARLAGVPMVLAGGLTPETVAEAVTLVRPDIVDVSSGVERAPAVKDPARVARFLEALGVIDARA